MITNSCIPELFFVCVFWTTEALQSCKGEVGGLRSWDTGGRRCFLHPERRPRTNLVQRCSAEKHPLQPEEKSAGLQP